MDNKKIVLLGPVGYGKSTTGCTLTENRFAFTTGEDINRVSLVLQIRTGRNGLVVIDCPGILFFMNKLSNYSF